MPCTQSLAERVNRKGQFCAYPGTKSEYEQPSSLRNGRTHTTNVVRLRASITTYSKSLVSSGVGWLLSRSQSSCSEPSAGFIDLFWKGVLLVEQKSAGRNLTPAKTQALDYFPGLKELGAFPRYILLSDFQNFELYDLDEGGEVKFRLADLPKHVELFGFDHRRSKAHLSRSGPR